MGEPKFKCPKCHKKIDVFERHMLAGETIFDPHAGMTYNTGNGYCKSCYNELTGQGRKGSSLKNNLSHNMQPPETKKSKLSINFENGKFWRVADQVQEVKDIFWGKYHEEKNKGLSVKDCMNNARIFTEKKIGET